MTINAARELRDGQVCLVGVGPPNAAANLARRLHAPGVVLVYESGAIGAQPLRLPLSIGDDDLAETSLELVGVVEMFNFWIGGGRMDVAFLGAAQIDRHANLNTTAIGPYDEPKVRLPGAGGAPEIAARARQVMVIVRHSPRTFVEKLDFVTSLGNEEGHTVVITDLGVLRPRVDRELELVALHPGVEVEQAQEATGWDLRVAGDLATTDPVTEHELDALRELRASAGR
jgi:glutaconate CoA-transferase subunit B